MAVGSAAWVLVVVVVVAIVIGSLLLTVTDPVAQALFDSAMWSSTTTYGTNTMAWVQELWAFMALIILIGLFSLVYIRTRRPG